MLQSLGMKVIAYDPYVSPEVFEKLRVDMVEFDLLLRDSDVVSLHARVTPETTGMIGEKELKIIKAWDGNIVNIFKWMEGLPFS